LRIPVLGLDDCTLPSSGASAPTYFEGGGLLSRAMVPPDTEYERRHRMLERYLEKRAGYIHAGNDTIH
jgi:hypothetical protein